MGFQQGLSGLDAASKQLDVIGNNVANANTVGFKGSRAEFGDMYANSFYGVAATQAGIGVQTLAVTQQMTQGNITTTNNNLDLAINNNGFFVVKSGSTTNNGSGMLQYTRNGQFQVDRDGYLVNNGDRLQGWSAVNGVVNKGVLSDLKLQTALMAPKVSTTVGMGVNLDSRLSSPTVTPLNPTNPNTFNWSNSTTIYDTLGNPQSLTIYYNKGTPTAAGTDWTATPYVNGAAAGAAFTLHFDTSGALTTTPAKLAVSYTPVTPTGAAQPLTMTVDYANSTQYGQGSATSTLTNDGYTSGNLSAMNISPTGIIQATFSNGQTNTIGQIALSNFANTQGLQAMGNNRWTETYSSGPSQLNAPGTGNAGTLRASALEASNVDLTTELVNMITAQRFYQANAQTIKTQDTVMQTLVNL